METFLRYRCLNTKKKEEMNRFGYGYRTRIRYRAVGVEAPPAPAPPPPPFGRKLKTKEDLHFTVGNTEFIKAYGLLAIPLSILTNMLLGLIF